MTKDKAEKVLAILNLKHDTNQISMIRTANHFGIKKVFIIGDELRHKEGSCKSCHRHMSIRSFEEWQFFSSIAAKRYKLVLIEKTENSVPIEDFTFPERCVIMTGHESNGFSKDFIDAADYIVHIPTLGDQVPCLNTGVACGIGLYEATKRDALHESKDVKLGLGEQQ